MRLRTVVAVSVAIIAAIGVIRAAKGAEHPAMTSDHPPGWQLQRALPGEPYKPRGRFFDTKTGCQLDLASDSFVQPKGTRLVCLHISLPSNRKATR